MKMNERRMKKEIPEKKISLNNNDDDKISVGRQSEIIIRRRINSHQG